MRKMLLEIKQKNDSNNFQNYFCAVVLSSTLMTVAAVQADSSLDCQDI